MDQNSDRCRTARTSMMVGIRGWLKDTVPRRRKRQLAAMRVRLNRPTARLRALPNLLIVGAQRSGTSSMYKYLGGHPEVAASLRKETDYLSVRYPEGEWWYRAHFPYRRLAPSVVFEATPDYLLDPRAAARAAELVPDARIVVMVRNPVDRAVSQYGHNRRLGQEPLSFEEALDAEQERLAGEVDRLMEDPSYPARPFRRYSYVTRGLYAQQLKRWSDIYPQDQIQVIRFEDFVTDPASVLRDLESFLGISAWLPTDFMNHSYGRAGPKSANSIAPQTLNRLVGTFAPHNQLLESTLNRSLEWDHSDLPGRSPS